MSVARRPLLTATAAGTLLGALWFVPSANATGEEPAASHSHRTTVLQAGATGDGRTYRDGAGQELRLADAATGTGTGTGVDAAPYVLGCAAFLAVGAGLVGFAVRRGAYAPL
ncbi:hypothetical protein M4914_14010 [Streptomyces somaliensis DSM 40738]|uniref:Uncharacterized protein n=1 Tax=Streptomyces somaliensis (strain ATCC 33201 / DSM 40738 / JCM 12659 / KCTC 9044 / NCTC 11332 / NRRL B-12077 / IP 733) TaxID=1134445 RepID=A0AA44DFK9_STRE0|nr:hypothetical protein [Streptomyces somaliensis]MCQ0023958.1 hypothetical protein [Streptomyces somaliensis DSM 40738]NKY15599.1 hypothetical protein [Streptomyces somaliensis DSM 40738]